MKELGVATPAALQGSSSSSPFPAISLGFTILSEFCSYVTIFLLLLLLLLFLIFNHKSSHIPSSWMVHAGCVFGASIHLSRT